MRIGQRIAYNSYYGTIKYIGPVSGYDGQWLGIDWDDETRGKHDGLIHGIRYFKSYGEKSGSFIRAEKVNFGVSIEDAIVQQYCSSNVNVTQKSSFVNRSIEFVGFDKVEKKQKDIQRLEVIDLRKKSINTFSSDKLRNICPELQDLDLSNNLFDNWLTILEICQSLPKLKSLNVSENRLEIPINIQEQFVCNYLLTLVCNKIPISSFSKTWKLISNSFPNLQNLFLQNNNFTQFNTLNQAQMIYLNTISLQDNDIVKWSEIQKLSSLIPNLENLIISNIKLNNIEITDENVFPNLKRLSINDNLINEWLSVSNLNQLKNLENLKFLRNPILQGEYSTYSSIIIARISRLKVLNGTEITKSDRKEAEYEHINSLLPEYFKIEHDLKIKQKFLILNPRFFEFLQKYNIDLDSERGIKPIKIKHFVNLRINFNDKITEQKFLYSMNISKFRFYIQRMCRLDTPPKLICTKHSNKSIQFELIHDLRSIDHYSLEDNDEVSVIQKTYKALEARENANVSIYTK